MPDRVFRQAERLLTENPDPVPKYLLLRDVISLEADDPLLAAAKAEAMASPQVAEFSARQLSDGSFGPFLIQPVPDVPNGGTNEIAMIRALSLGVDIKHPVLHGLRSFFENTLDDLLEEVSKPHEGQTFPVARALILAGCLNQLNSSHPEVRQIIERWKRVIIDSFSGDQFQISTFRDRCEEVFGPDFRYWPDKWPEQGISRYTLLLMQDQLPFAIEEAIMNYLIHHTRGIYPIGNRSLKYFPLKFDSREAVRFITQLELLARYTSAVPFLRHAADWIWEHTEASGFWDLGTAGRDNKHLPLSASWRSHRNRVIDSSVRVLSLLANLQQTCELYDTTCHSL